jgi:outer membrane biogenesis lipoprotein LolB
MPIARPVSLTTLALLPAVLLTGCTGPTAEVRTTLCQAMTAIALGEAPAWRGTDTHLHGYQDAVIEVRFATSQSEGQAACHFRHLKGDDTALTLANPLEAYATSPAHLSVNGRDFSGPELARLMEQALQQQGREFVDRVQDRVRGH